MTSLRSCGMSMIERLPSCWAVPLECRARRGVLSGDARGPCHRGSGLYSPSILSGVSRSAEASWLYVPYNRSMAVTVKDILAVPGHAAEAARRPGAGATRPIRWVHVCELEDPTPWLKGGELILTTGMGVGTTPAKQRAYVKRLAEAGLAGLGFGLGFSHDKTPRSLVTAADLGGLPALRGALPGAVHRDHRGRLHADRRRAVRHAAAGRRRRTRAHARRDGGPGRRGHRAVARRRHEGVGAAARPARPAARHAPARAAIAPGRTRLGRAA